MESRRCTSSMNDLGQKIVIILSRTLPYNYFIVVKRIHLFLDNAWSTCHGVGYGDGSASKL